MTVSPTRVLSILPPYRDEWVLIKKEQYVPDIIKEIEAAHRLYGKHYDMFSYMFYTTDPDQLANSLWRFCKDNLRYNEETKEFQTSAIPAGIITRGDTVGVDCKHYALFSAGVIGSLNRLYDCCFEAYYCFAAYRKDVDEPYHVFVSLIDNNTEVWIDPTPGSGGTPTLLKKKRI